MFYLESVYYTLYAFYNNLRDPCNSYNGHMVVFIEVVLWAIYYILYSTQDDNLHKVPAFYCKL